MNKDRIYSSRTNSAPSVVGKRRTRFNLSRTKSFTCNTGDFVPCFIEEVLPGDTFDIKTATLARLQTSIHQTLDNAYLEIAFFYVPDRIIFDGFDKMLGANDDAWARTSVVKTPQIILASYGDTNTSPATVSPQSLLNHLMLPAGTYLSGKGYHDLSDDLKSKASVTALPLRAVYQVYNDWFRSESVDSVVAFSKGSYDNRLTDSNTFNGDSFAPRNSILKVNRFHDRFSSALPAPQKGAPVTFSLGGSAPVIAKSTDHSLGQALKLGFSGGNPDTYLDNRILWMNPANTKDNFVELDLAHSTPANVLSPGTGTTESALIERGATDQTTTDAYRIDRSNLYADLSAATAVTINDLRLAIATQVLAEQEARGGTRLQEVLFSQWNLKAPSLMLDRSEYLGGKRIPLSMLEVVQTSETNGTQLLGDVAGLGKTFDADSGSALKSFMLHGYILGFSWIRTARSYSQGIDRKFFRTDKYSYFNPIFDNIGELPVYGKELLVPTFDSDYNSSMWDQVFGYQEAWYEYKEGLNSATGYMQTGISGSVGEYWQYGDLYAHMPLLANDWLKEDVERVDRTISVKSTATYGYQWQMMIDFEVFATRQMAKYSVPNTFGFGSR